MALALEEREGARLPGELPPAFRRLHRHTHHSKPAIAQHSLCTSSEDDLAAEVCPHGLQENQQTEINEVNGDLFKVIDRLDGAIERLMKSCKVKPNIELHMDTRASVEEPFNSRVLEDRLDQIIHRLSQSGYLSRLSKELCVTPLRSNLANEKPAWNTPKSSSMLSPLRTRGILARAHDDDTPLRANPANEKSACNLAKSSSTLSPSLRTCGILGKAHDGDQVKNPTTPTSSFRMPLLTPRCLLSKFGSSEKVDLFASPTTTGRLSSGRSGRFSAAFSFLTSPKKVGSVSSIMVTSPKPSDPCLER